MPIRDCLIEPMKRGESYYSVNVLCIDIVQFKFELQIQVGHLLLGQLLSSALDQEKVEDCIFGSASSLLENLQFCTFCHLVLLPVEGTERGGHSPTDKETVEALASPSLKIKRRHKFNTFFTF